MVDGDLDEGKSEMAVKGDGGRINLMPRWSERRVKMAYGPSE